jgi:hypothetical protein
MKTPRATTTLGTTARRRGRGFTARSASTTRSLPARSPSFAGAATHRATCSASAPGVWPAGTRVARSSIRDGAAPMSAFFRSPSPRPSKTPRGFQINHQTNKPSDPLRDQGSRSDPGLTRAFFLAPQGTPLIAVRVAGLCQPLFLEKTHQRPSGGLVFESPGPPFWEMPLSGLRTSSSA